MISTWRVIWCVDPICDWIIGALSIVDIFVLFFSSRILRPFSGQSHAWVWNATIPRQTWPQSKHWREHASRSVWPNRRRAGIRHASLMVIIWFSSCNGQRSRQKRPCRMQTRCNYRLLKNVGSLFCIQYHNLLIEEFAGILALVDQLPASKRFWAQGLGTLLSTLIMCKTRLPLFGARLYVCVVQTWSLRTANRKIKFHSVVNEVYDGA